METAIVEAVQQVAADFEFFHKLRIGLFLDVVSAVVVTVALRIAFHRLLQGCRNAHIVDDQATGLFGEHAVHPCNGLHKVVVPHGFVDVHRGERGHIESRQPHVHHNGNLHRVVHVLELPRQFLSVGFAADDVHPLLGVLVAAGHHHLHFLRPFGAQFKHPVVYLHGNGARVGHNHRLAAADVLAVVLIVADDVRHKVVDGHIVSQQGIHVRHLLLVGLDVGFRSTFFPQTVVFGINLRQHFVVELQLDYPALVVDGACGAVVDGLRHIVDVDVVAEDFARVAVLVRDGRAGEADVRGIGQRVADFPGSADVDISLGVNLFLHPVLAAVCLVGHDDDVPAVGKGAVPIVELLHGGEDDAARMAVLQQGSERGVVVLGVAAGALHCTLAQKVNGARELPVELLVEVVAVGDDHNGGAHGLHLGMVCQKNHRKALARTLRVPEHPNLAVLSYCTFGPGGGFLHSVILVIARQYLGILPFADIEEQIVPQKVEQHLGGEHRPEGHIVVGHLAAGLFPLHIAVFVCRDGTDFGKRHIAQHVEGIVDEERGDEFLIVADLKVRLAGIGLFAAGRFQLDDHQRQSVHKHHDVRTFGVEVVDRELVDDQEIVLFGMLEIDEVDNPCLFARLPFHVPVFSAIVGEFLVEHACGREGHLDAILHHLRELEVALIERRALYLMQFPDGIVDGRSRQSRVDALQRIVQHIVQQRIAIVAFDVRTVNIAVGLTFETLEETYQSLFVCIFRKC